MTSKNEVLQKLAEIATEHPRVVEDVLRENPEWRKVFTDEVETLRLTTLAHQDSPEGFFAYYEGKYGFPPQVLLMPLVNPSRLVSASWNTGLD